MFASDLLLPRPQRCEPEGEPCTLPNPLSLQCMVSAPAAQLATTRLVNAFRTHGHAVTCRAEKPSADGPSVRLAIDKALISRPQAYRLIINDSGIRLIGADEAGLVYGVATLIQWIGLHPPRAANAWSLPAARIDDWPDFLQRGVMLDISRSKVPTLKTLYALIDLLASCKINQLQLYTEHTFAYRGHDPVWATASPLTSDDVRALDAYCQQRAIELVPNQNSFGHFHRWLSCDAYRHLAECPKGMAHPFSNRVEPFSLCPTDPAALALLEDLYDQLLPHFQSQLFNVGCDETFDLGRGRSAAACAARGRHRVYLDFLNQVHALVTARGHRMQYWADIVLERPDLLGDVPRDAIALLWGYEACHPFAEQTQHLAAAGLDYYVCPGTSSWNSFAGRVDNAIANCANAAAHGKANHASGYLITDWGDWGHLQPLPVSYPGLLAGAAAAWNAAKALDPHIMADMLSRYALVDPSGHAARAAIALGNAYQRTECLMANSSVLFQLLIFNWRTFDAPRYASLTLRGFDQTQRAVEAALDTLSYSTMQHPDAALIHDEYRWVAALLKTACAIGRARLLRGQDTPLAALDRTTRAALAVQLEPCIDHHASLWHARNQPGGRQESRQHLLSTYNLLLS